MLGDLTWTQEQADKLYKGAQKFLSLTEKIRDQSRSVALYEMQDTVEAAYPVLEKSWDILKNFIVESGRPNALLHFDRLMTEISNVEIGFTEEGWFRLKMPRLPSKEEARNVHHIRDILYAQLEASFVTAGLTPRYSNCAIIFRHIYRYDVPEAEYRDHDNIELNMVVDAIALYVMQDDNGKRCQHHYCSAAGADNSTEVYVVPIEDLVQWLRKYNVVPNEV